MPASSFRAFKWDPALIIAQITAIQSLFYIILSLILYITVTLNGNDISLDLIFNDQQIRVDTSYGWTLIIVWIATAICSIFLLLFIVQRARQILDYVLTFHLFHLLFVWNSNRHFPTGFTWWILQLINILIMTFGGEWACMNREMRPIKVKGSNDTTNTNNSAEASDSRNHSASSHIPSKIARLFNGSQTTNYDYISLETVDTLNRSKNETDNRS